MASDLREAVAAAASAVVSLRFPSPADWHCGAALSPAFAARSAALAARCAALLRRFEGGASADGDAPLDVLSSVLDVELDRCAAALEEHRAAAAAAAAAASTPAPAPSVAAARAGGAGAGGFARQQSHQLRKPQDAWPVKPDNSEAPFALPPPFGARGGGFDGVSHPFASVVYALNASTQPTSLPPPLPLHLAAPASVVDTEAGLASLAALLEAQTEFCFDIEAHSHRSFLGFVCLLQITAGGCDFLVDCLALRFCIRKHLSRAFADPSIVKVAHGADADVVWLQRDFGMYVVNLFDTGQAARVLAWDGGPGLKHLLSRLFSFDADKTHQLGDWRVRPLPPAMATYAQAVRWC